MEEKPDPCSTIQLPPGFRFYPSDEELIVHYLRNKVTSSPVPASIIAEIDLYKFNPWDLPNQALFGEEEWYFFTPRDRKYPNGARPNRAAASGYWKATGTDKPIVTSCGSKRVGVKKALVFYAGRPPKGVKTDWIMNEYRILDAMIWSSKRKGSMRATTAFSVVVNDSCEEGKPIGDINDSGFFQPYDNNNGEEEVMASAENNLVNMINYGDGSAWAQETIEGSSSYLAGYEWNINSSTSTQSQFLELNGMMAFNGTPLQFD